MQRIPADPAWLGCGRPRCRKADPGFPRSASIGGRAFNQLEGLAVAIPWGFNPPLSHQLNQLDSLMFVGGQRGRARHVGWCVLFGLVATVVQRVLCCSNFWLMLRLPARRARTRPVCPGSSCSLIAGTCAVAGAREAAASVPLVACRNPRQDMGEGGAWSVKDPGC